MFWIIGPELQRLEKDKRNGGKKENFSVEIEVSQIPTNKGFSMMSDLV